MALGDLLFPNIKMRLIISHAFDADVESAKDKFSPEYLAAAAKVSLSKGDMQKLSLKDGKTVQVKSTVGDVVVHVSSNDKGRDGIAVMPYGPWALSLIDVPKDGSPPQLHGVSVTVTKSDSDVTPLLDLLRPLE
jgi:formylmethanofuran dehydrogenase subunit D